MKATLERIFHLTEKGTTVRKEIVGGIVTFITMSYILAVNPSILGVTGMDPTAVMLATAIASAVSTILMGLLANLPFALSAGMGLNAFFAFSVVLGKGYSWQFALFCVFIEGLIFVILSLAKVREAIFNVIPQSLKYGISAGIGGFIFFIGLQNCGLVQGNASTLVELINFKASFSTAGICALLAVIGFLLTVILNQKGVPGAILIGMVATYLIGILCQLIGIYVPDPETGFYSLFPSLSATDFSALGLTFGQCFNADFSSVNLLDTIVITLTFLYSDIFDTAGTLIGGATKGNMLDENGKLPKIKGALLADSIGTVLGSICGTSTVTTFVESTSGIAAGARTGLASIVTGVLFLIATFAASLFTSIPSFATAGALMYVGFLMFSQIGKLKLDDDNKITTIVPAIFCIFGMVFFYSIAEGIAVGVISYVILNLVCGKRKEIHWLMYVLALVFIAKYIFL